MLRSLFVASALFLACQPASAAKRVALVIGNSAYQNAPALPNPVNDGAVIAKTLRDGGFDFVDSRHDLSALETRRALRDFADRAHDADVAVVYYAGHGLEVDGTNYLIPVDAKLERDTDVFDEAFSLDRILVAVEPAKQLRLIILDACRDNPFAKTMKRTVASRAIGQGLAKIEPNAPNLLIAYSAKAGSTASDGSGSNSPFTVALSKHLTTPGLDVRRAFGFVRDDVLKVTNNKQEPFVYGSLGGEDLPLVPAAKPAVAAAPAAAAPDPQAETRREYELALQIGNKAGMNAFLAQHPEGFYASLAKLQLEKMTTEETRVAATEKARLTEQERARLAAEGAQKTQQAKADSDAKAAEAARVAAEHAKEVAQQQAAAAEQKRAEAETKAAVDKKAASDSGASNRAAADTSTADKASGSTPGPSLASLSPASPPPADLTKSVQTELRRVGCLNGSADGEWNTTTQRSLSAFNRNAGTKLDTKVASTDALDAIKLKPSRVCPLVCEHGFKTDGDRCSKIVCAEGSFINDDNECEKRRAKTPTAKREPEKRDSDERRERADRTSGERPRSEPGYGRPSAPEPRRAAASASAKPSGQVVCDTAGCRPVSRGCHLEYRTFSQGGPLEGQGGNVQICN
jgi:uncharacterized caspase-like protein